ncbi:hypothetical protein [Microbacterium sp. 77mftsu3.1]|uniref:hypothetical protein n=1 Tax=Microbacterium sp. 77mftsu3.1 TaxID=1761802 RepID=UPI00115FDF76|nr:hypothetical protein [Microbacterium sp. 77mftsu3.1]
MGLFKRKPSQWDLEREREKGARHAFQQKVRDGLVIEPPRDWKGECDRYHCDPRTGIVTFCLPSSRSKTFSKVCYIAASANGHYRDARQMSEDVEAMQGHFARNVLESGIPVAEGHYVAHLFDPRAPDTLDMATLYMRHLQPGTLIYVYETGLVLRTTSRHDRFELVSGELPWASQKYLDRNQALHGGHFMTALKSGGRLEYPTAAEPPFIVNWRGGRLLEQEHVRHAAMPGPPRPRGGLLD